MLPVPLRCRRMQAGTTDVLVENLPGVPDGITRASAGGFCGGNRSRIKARSGGSSVCAHDLTRSATQVRSRCRGAAALT